jgi:uncharacterized protein
MQDVIGVLVMFGPLLVVLWLASLADGQRERENRDGAQILSILAIAMLVLLYLVLGGVGVLMHGLGLLVRGGLARPELLNGYRQMGVDPAALAAGLPEMGLSLWLPALIGMILLLRPVRRLCARLIPINPDRTVHAVALSFPALVVINLWFTLAFGLGNLAAITQFSASQGQQAVTLPGVWAQELLMALMGLVGVGWLSRRSLAATLERLAIRLPALPQIGLGLASALVLVPVVLAIELLSSRLGIGVNQDVEKLSQQLIGPLGRSIPGILTLGLAAALGEETMFRGALQPRFGLPLTALLFALLHSTYGLSISTLAVFLVGLVLGVIRQRANTTTSMIVHATYNMLLGLITYLGLFQNF